MKKSLLTLILCVFALSAAAQKGEMTASLQFMLGTGSGITNPGLGAKFSYSITDPWRLAASFDYGFKNKGTSSWDVNIDAQYQFFFGDKFRVYPMAGLALVGYTAKADKDLWDAAEEAAEMWGYDIGPRPSAKTTCFGLNLGGGFQYDINEAWAVYTEVKGQIVSKHGSRFVWGVGGSYKF